MQDQIGNLKSIAKQMGVIVLWVSIFPHQDDTGGMKEDIGLRGYTIMDREKNID